MRASHRGAALLALTLGALGGGSVGDAAAQEPGFTCRASAGYSDRAGEDRAEPVVANGNTNTTEANADRPRCADDNARTADRNVGLLQQRNPSAETTIDPDTGATNAQRATSSARAESTTLANGTFLLETDEVTASATASCTGTTPAFSSTSQVTNARINGQPVATDQQITQIGTGLNGSPLGGLIQVQFNEETPGGGVTSQAGLTRRAVHVTIKDGAGAVIYEAVSGEAKVGSNGDVCAATPPAGGGPGGGGPGGTTPGGGTCPSGASFDGQSGFCVKFVSVGEAADGSCPVGATRTEAGCVRVVPVNALGMNLVGGSVLPIERVPGIDASPCKDPRYGARVAIVGSDKKDKITGTNKSDRIFVFGADDIVSAGRGFDCVEAGPGRNRVDGGLGGDFLLGGPGSDNLGGGLSNDRVIGNAGNDRLDGGIGNDTVMGGAGNDKLTGGRGNDRLIGGAGNDYIVPDRGGKDVVDAGAGNDVINAAVAGKPAKVNCGPGKDTVRVNKNGLKKLRGCERKLVSKRVR